MAETLLDSIRPLLVPRYNNFPQGKYASLILVRQTESEAIFRTEGSGEPLNKEFVHASDLDDDSRNPIIQRVVISKRKQTAVERRQGRELLRSFELLQYFEDKKKNERFECALNRNRPCEKCMDCLIYGFAAGGGGAQKSRVITDDAFSLHEARIVTDKKQFNGLFDNGTMRDTDGEPSTSLGTDEYVRPQTTFLDIETLHDLSLEEFVYAVGNVLRSSRYGAISSRIGSVKNVVAGVVFSDCELFSNLELTQAVYRDQFLPRDGADLQFPLRTPAVVDAVRRATDDLLKQVPGRVNALDAAQTDQLIAEITAVYQDEQMLRTYFETATRTYGVNG